MMNKIEKAIYDTKLRIKKKEDDRIILIAEINLLREQLETLEIIERDKSIPYIQPLEKFYKDAK